jgi:hypothetical protein
MIGHMAQRPNAYPSSVELDEPRRIELTPAKVAAAMRAFFRIGEAWGLGAEQMRVLLGQPSRATLYNWKRGAIRTVPLDTVSRLSLVLGIWKALQILFPDPAQADGWVHRPNELLGGQSALERMLAGEVTDLAEVRALCDAARGASV